jgi:hypothetical protein
MWERVIASMGGTTMSCEGKQNSRNDSEDGVSWKYWEWSEWWEKGDIIASIAWEVILIAKVLGVGEVT